MNKLNKLTLLISLIIASTSGFTTYELGDTGVSLRGNATLDLMWEANSFKSKKENAVNPDTGIGEEYEVTAQVYFEGKHPSTWGDIIWATGTKIVAPNTSYGARDLGESYKSLYVNHEVIGGRETWFGLDNKQYGRFRAGYIYSNLFYVLASGVQGLGRVTDDGVMYASKYRGAVEYSTPVFAKSFKLKLQQSFGAYNSKETAPRDSTKEQLKTSASEFVLSYSPQNLPFNLDLGYGVIKNQDAFGGDWASFKLSGTNGSRNTLNVFGLKGGYKFTKTVSMSFGATNEQVSGDNSLSAHYYEDGFLSNSVSYTPGDNKFKRNRFNIGLKYQFTPKDSIETGLLMVGKLTGVTKETQNKETIYNKQKGFAIGYSRDLGPASFNAQIRSFEYGSGENAPSQFSTIDGSIKDKSMRLVVGFWKGW